MLFLDVLYSQYFLFYTKVLKDGTPRFTTCFALSSSLSFLINGVIDLISITYYCHKLDKWFFIAVFCVILGLNYLFYIVRGRGDDIVKSQPLIFNSQKISAICAFLFFLITLSYMFWGSVYGKYILDNC